MNCWAMQVILVLIIVAVTPCIGVTMLLSLACILLKTEPTNIKLLQPALTFVSEFILLNSETYHEQITSRRSKNRIKI